MRYPHGPTLRRLRESTGVRVGPLAEAAGCNKDHLRLVEYGRRRPSPELAHRLARELGRLLNRTVAVEEFYDGKRSGRGPDVAA